MISVRLRGALGVFLVATLFASAVRACPGERGEMVPAASEARLALEAELAREAAPCARSPGFLALRAALLLADNRPEAAAPLLEQALLIDPNHAGAQIDYAQALAALGDRKAAIALLDDVLRRPDVPLALAVLLRERRSQYENPPASGWQGRGSVALKRGYDSNLNSAPSGSNFNLTFPDGPATLTIADRLRARGGAAWMLEGSGQTIRQMSESGVWGGYGDIRIRKSAASEEVDYRQIDLATSWSAPYSGGENSLIVGLSDLNYGGNAMYRAIRLQGVHERHTPGTCLPRLGAELEARRYPVSTELDGLFMGFSGGFVCVFDDFPAIASIRVGRDKPDGDRPGGNQNRIDLRVYRIQPFGLGRVTADLTLGVQRDAEGFSPLLENGDRRRLVRGNLRLEYAHPLASTWEAIGSIEWMEQRGNLKLFDISGVSAYLGLRRIW